MSKSSLKQTLKDLDTKKISIRELNQDYLKRIKENENLNVFIHFSEDNVLKQIDNLEKVNSAKPEWGPSYPDVTQQQIQDSFDRIGKSPIDLMQIHNLGDIKTQLPMIQQLKDEGRARYIAVSYTHLTLPTKA